MWFGLDGTFLSQLPALYKVTEVRKSFNTMLHQSTQKPLSALVLVYTAQSNGLFDPNPNSESIAILLLRRILGFKMASINRNSHVDRHKIKYESRFCSLLHFHTMKQVCTTSRLCLWKGKWQDIFHYWGHHLLSNSDSVSLFEWSPTDFEFGFRNRICIWSNQTGSY